MHHFFVDRLEKSSKFPGAFMTTIVEKQAHHLINVLRAEIGEEISVACFGHNYQGFISEIRPTHVVVEQLTLQEQKAELPFELILVQGLPKSDKLEFIITKACELGVSKILPLQCERSITRDKADKAEKITIRRNEIALAACKQAHRSQLVKVEKSIAGRELFQKYQFDYCLIAYEKSDLTQSLAKYWQTVKKSILTAPKRKQIAVVVGPEGGFTPAEIAYFTANNADIVNLGARILRTETAGLALLSYIMLDSEQ